ncbi:LuxR family transcriptional regulator [Kitasatospora xanthocidica]|uniref:LuxR family transcriptional regulator n=1 Tax=Kitasatospora xanthocidica TaxID=83382 RepID=A0A372ZRK5_9ACTN|nr:MULTISPECIES: helix-turn-helix transcriptional regulator [Streptomycetaceae]OKI07754.1 LuxR family transcriptional regulator [Streptomyces sp. CB02056]RGD58483.1 LuxR family transcriptional regulator [Kitasatospora xanthocidica]
MLEVLGIEPSAEAVYRLIVEEPGFRVVDMAERLGWSEERVRVALNRLAELDLVNLEDGCRDAVPFNPDVGFGFLLSRATADLSRRQRQIESAEQAVTALSARFNANRASRYEVIHRLEGLDMVRKRLEDLASTAERECLSLLPGGAQLPDTMDASEPLDRQALERGVRIRSVYQESFRNDPATLEYVRWFTRLGGQACTVPFLPLLLVVVDRETALVPIDPQDGRAGALEVRTPGVVSALALLFEEFWAAGTPFGQDPRRNEHDLTPQERELLLLLSIGCTDEVASRRLGLSLRTVRRMSSQLMNRLGARSRFEAGVRAAKEGWL